MPLYLIFYVSLTFIVGYAYRYGGRSERICATILLGGSMLSVLVIMVFHNHWHAARHALLLVDSAALAALVALALRSDRFWPLYTAAYQVPEVVTHIATMVDPFIVPRAYALAQGFWIYPMLAALGIGTYNFRKRQQRLAARTLQETGPEAL